jgi:hypothetical protein
MATISEKAYETAVVILQGANEVNSLAHGSLGAVSGAGTGTIFDNTSLLDLYAHFELNVGTLGSAPLAGGWWRLYFWKSLDGTNYEFAPGAATQTPYNPDLMDPLRAVGDFKIPLGFGTTGRIQLSPNINFALPPGKGKFQLLNMSGVALPSSGASVSMRAFNLTSA